MSNIIIPELNPIKLFEITTDTWEYCKILWENKRRYFQKYITADTLRFQIIIPSESVITSFAALLVIDDNDTGTSIPMSAIGANSGDVTYEGVKALAGLAGKHLVKIVFGLPENGEIIVYSEPIEILSSSDNTVLIQYGNDVNDFDLIFQPYLHEAKIFDFRVEGCFPSDGFKPSSVDDVYIDQSHNTTMLSSIPFNINQFQFGGEYGCPNWIADKFNRILSCNNVTIDGVPYTKSEGSKLEPARTENYALAGWKIDLIKSENNYSLLIT
ncbi:MAG: hypothetical protein ACOYMF_06030 [Bacteroidales bacterium]